MNSRVLFDVRQQRLFIIGCLVCLALSWRSFLVFEGTEFGGGTLARNNAFGAWLFLAAVVLVLRYQLLASVTSLIACVYSLPLYLYLLFPLLFREHWPVGNWKVQALSGEAFVWNPWWAVGTVATVVVVSISCVTNIRNLFARATTD
jgi:hypothetical protein